KDLNIYGVLRFFRSVFFASVILYFGTEYLIETKALIESDQVFGMAAKNAYSLSYMSFNRNMGFTWDHRIMAIFAYLFLLISIIFKPKYYKLDIILSLIIVLTTTSRGGMITYGLILSAYLFQVYKYKFIATLS